jgi:hypothetical protein
VNVRSLAARLDRLESGSSPMDYQARWDRFCVQHGLTPFQIGKATCFEDLLEALRRTEVPEMVESAEERPDLGAPMGPSGSTVAPQRRERV